MKDDFSSYLQYGSVVTCLTILLDKFDLIAVWIFHKGNHGYTAFHWTCFTNHITATCLDFLTGLIGIIHSNGNMAISIAQLITCRVPVMGQFKYGMVFFIAIAHKSQGKTTLFVITLTKQSHTKYRSIELQRLFHVAYT